MKKQIDLLSVPYDSGHLAARMGRGPLHLIDSGLDDHLRSSGHDLRVRTIESDAEFPTEAAVAFELARKLSGRVRAAREEGHFPLVLAGNCNSSLGTVAGLGSDGLGVIWFDGHGDLNTPETTRSGYLDGMSLAALTGRCWREAAGGIRGFSPVADRNVLLLGARDFDPGEREVLEDSEIVALDPESVRTGGAGESVGPAFDELSDRVRRVYLHLDLDVLDPEDARVNQYAAPEGLSVDELVGIVEQVAARFTISGAALTAYDPAFDADGVVCRAATEIVEAVVRKEHADQP